MYCKQVIDHSILVCSVGRTQQAGETGCHFYALSKVEQFMVDEFCASSLKKCKITLISVSLSLEMAGN